MIIGGKRKCGKTTRAILESNERLDELCISKEESLFEKSKRLYSANKDKLTEEDNKVIEYLDSEILEYSEIGYDRIERKIEFSEHGLLRAKRIATHYDEQGFSVELNDLSNLFYPDRFEISIGWRE